jgi:autotransporter-associated beta strand protein
MQIPVLKHKLKMNPTSETEGLLRISRVVSERSLLRILTAYLLFTSALPAAAVFVWDGGHPSQNKWSNQENWNPNGVPDNDGTADLIFSGTARLTPVLDVNYDMKSITFNNLSGAFTFVDDGNDSEGIEDLTLQGLAGVGILNDDSDVQTFNIPIILGATQTWNANNGNLTFAGTTITNGGFTLTLTGAKNTTILNVISGTGALTKTGAGTAILSGANTYSGGTTVSAGTLQGTTTSIQGAVINNATVEFNQSTSGTYASIMSGTGILNKAGSGTVTLSGVNTYTGTTNINAGTLTIGNSSSNISDSSAVTVSSGATFDLDDFNETIGSLAGSVTLGSGALTTGGDNSSTTFSGIMSETGSLTKNGNGTFTLTGANTYSGGTTVSAGTLQGTTTSIQGDIANNASVVFNQTTTGTYSDVISGSGTLTKSGSGMVTLTGVNTYSGTTTVSAGTLTIGNSSSNINDSSAVTVSSGATFDLDNFDETIGSLAGAGSVDLSSGALTAGGDNSSTTFSGIMSETGSLTKSGSGTFTLSGANTYSGGTTVNAGTLEGTTTSLQGNITNSATVEFDQSTPTRTSYPVRGA